MIDNLLNSTDLYVLFDGCPTCRPENLTFLDSCRETAQRMQRRLSPILSGSVTATVIRTIAKNQGKPVEYPLILLDGTIYYTPAEISEKQRKEPNDTTRQQGTPTSGTGKEHRNPILRLSPQPQQYTQKGTER